MGEPGELRQMLDSSLTGVRTVGIYQSADSSDRARGLLALRLGLPLGEVEGVFGLEWCERERLAITAGRCHQGLPEVTKRGDDGDPAR